MIFGHRHFPVTILTSYLENMSVDVVLLPRTGVRATSQTHGKSVTCRHAGRISQLADLPFPFYMRTGGFDTVIWTLVRIYVRRRRMLCL